MYVHPKWSCGHCSVRHISLQRLNLNISTYFVIKQVNSGLVEHNLVYFKILLIVWYPIF